jgi:hypothetical protein
LRGIWEIGIYRLNFETKLFASDPTIRSKICSTSLERILPPYERPSSPRAALTTATDTVTHMMITIGDSRLNEKARTMFSVIFEVFPKNERFEKYLALARHLKPILDKIDGLLTTSASKANGDGA